MVIYADTSLGNPIWVDWKLDKNGKKMFIFPNFSQIIEIAEARYVFQVLIVKFSRKGCTRESWAYVQAGLAHYSRLATAQLSEVTRIERELGIRDAFDRAEVGRKLLRAEFRDSAP